MKYHNNSDWISYIFFFAVIALIVITIIGSIVNFGNKIDCGTIINKKIVSLEHYDTRYYFTIKGDKNGRTVKYIFAVTEQEYDRYNIGDYYNRKGQ